ncbi:MAG: DUF4118 domain-containing protein [Lachnospiraceae bacterium]|nr:DUF4118 domain-containing protein [Lachnospiraceae bacterium]
MDLKEKRLFPAAVMAMSLGTMTLCGYLFRLADFPETNIVLLYIVAVLLTARFTDGYFWGIAASGASMFAFNFFFTEPYFTFKVDNTSYIITFGVMMLVAVLTSALTSKDKLHARQAEEREKEVKMLYQLTNHLSHADTLKEAGIVAVEAVSRFFDCKAGCIYDIKREKSVFHYLEKTDGKILHEEISLSKAFLEKMRRCKNGYEIEGETMEWSIHGREGLMGILRVPMKTAELFEEHEKKFLSSMIENISITMERIHSSEERYRNKELMEQERYRANLLRSISHDLRTPLMGIMGSSEMIMGISKKEDPRKKMAMDIYQDASWLHSLVENILGLTRLQEGKLELRKSPEAIEDLIAAAVRRVEKGSPGYEIAVEIPEEYIEVLVDGRLIEQVIVNLLENAVKHTKKGEEICVRAKKRSNDEIEVSVMDRGEGIAKADLDHIFQTFYTSMERPADARLGIGLGLVICETVIKAHGGTITGENRTDGKGAVFCFTLPLRQ